MTVNAFVQKLSGFGSLSEQDLALLTSLSQRSRMHPPGHDLIREGDTPGPLFLVLEGWAIRYKLLPGGGRQIISFMMPGDFCDLHVAILSEMDHGISTLTTARIAAIPRSEVEAIVQANPEITRAFWWAQLVDESTLRATIVSLGRRTSLERVAHLLCELCFRMRKVGLAPGDECEMPFTQIVLADAVGLTPVHVNRVIRTLREAGAVKVDGGTILISDLLLLAKIAGFDESYLHARLGQDQAFGKAEKI